MADHIRLKLNRVLDDRQLDDLSEKLIDGIATEYICTEKVCNGNAVILAFERYFLRTGNYAGLTVVLSKEPDSTSAVAIGSGGGGGMLNLSFGANRSFVGEAERILIENGFEPVPADEGDN